MSEHKATRSSAIAKRCPQHAETSDRLRHIKEPCDGPDSTRTPVNSPVKATTKQARAAKASDQAPRRTLALSYWVSEGDVEFTKNLMNSYYGCFYGAPEHTHQKQTAGTRKKSSIVSWPASGKFRGE